MSRKEKEVVVRLSEADLRAREYIREYFGVDVDEEINKGKNEEKENNA